MSKNQAKRTRSKVSKQTFTTVAISHEARKTLEDLVERRSAALGKSIPTKNVLESLIEAAR